MTEQDWLTCTDPQRMLNFLGVNPHPNAPRGIHFVNRGHTFSWSDRKLRLFAVACCQHYGVEQDLDPDRDRIGSDANWAKAWASRAVKQSSRGVYNYVTQQTEPDVRCDILRDIFGNPFRPVKLPRRYKPHPSMPNIVPIGCPWLTWNDRLIPRMAQTIYDERRFEDMPILADAVEEAGCTNQEILMHLRGLEFVDDRTWATQPIGGPHVRGCWVIDLFLGKE